MIAFYIWRTLAGFANVRQIYNNRAPSNKQNKHQFKIYVHKISNPQYFAQVIATNHSLSQTNRLLHALLTGGSSINKNNFQSIFKKYCYYIEHIPNRAGYDQQSFAQKLKFLQKATDIYDKYGKLASKHMIKTFNNVSDAIINNLKQNLQSQEYVPQILNAITSVSRYNKNKAIACFKSIQAKLAHPRKLKQMDKSIALAYIELMPKIGIYNRLILETCIDILMNEVEYVNFQDISQILYCLASSHYPINRAFMAQIIARVDKHFQHKIDHKTGQSLPKNQYVRRNDLNLLSSLSIIQSSMNLASAYLPELSNLYEKQLYQIGVNSLSRLNNRDLQKYCNFLRRTCYYDENLLANLASQIMKRDVIQLNQISNYSNHDNNNIKLSSMKMKHNLDPQDKTNNISVNTLCSALHTLALFNFRNQPFISYFVTLLQILSNAKRIQQNMKNQQPNLQSSVKNEGHFILFETINIKHYSRVIWSLCVLGTKEELSKVFKIFQYFFKGELIKNERMSEVYNMMNIYYCYLLLKAYFPSKDLSFEKIMQKLEDKHLLTTVSKTHHKIYSVFIQVGIPCLKQHNISNIMCDIFVPRYISLDGKSYVQNVVIDLHGPHHFMRNCDAIKGGSALKKKILNSQGYFYQYIGVNQWELVSNKRKFVLNLMENIVAKLGKPFSSNGNKTKLKQQNYLENQRNSQKNKLTPIEQNDQLIENEVTPKIEYSRKKGRSVRTNSLKLDLNLNNKQD